MEGDGAASAARVSRNCETAAGTKEAAQDNERQEERARARRGGGENRADPATGGGATRWEGRLYTERGQERSVEEEWAHARRDKHGSSSLGRSTRASCFFLSALSSALGYLMLCLG